MKTYGNRILLAVTVLFSIAIYASLWNYSPLSWDDNSNIFANPYYTMHVWWGPWLEPYFGLYVPLTSSAWAFLYWVGGGESWPYRLFNVVIHSANILLVYVILKKLADRWHFTNPCVVGLSVMVFAFHPLQVESVAWISGGRDLLSTFFALGAVILYFGFPSVRGFIFAMIAYGCALLSKPSVAVLPLVIVFIDCMMLKRSLGSALKSMSVWIMMSLTAIYITQFAQVEHFTDRIEWWQRPLVMMDTYAFYVRQVLWPFSLSGNYARTPEFILTNPGVLGVSAFTIILVVGVLLWVWPRDRRLLIFAFVWVLLLLPTSGVVPFGYQDISQVADHYNYLPLVAVAILFMLVLAKLPQRPAVFALPAALIGIWTASSYARTKVWENDFTFFSDMAKTAPNSYSTAVGMSVALCAQKKDYEGGLYWVGIALAAKRYDVIALSNRAYCLIHSGRFQEAVDMLEILERVDRPHLAETQPTAYSSWLASMGTALIELRQFEKGYALLCEAYKVMPTEPNHVKNLKAANEILKQQGLTPNCGTTPMTGP